MTQPHPHERTGSEQSGISRMENEGGYLSSSRLGATDLEAELVQYGIVSIPTTFFEWGGFRYTNAHDAIAAAKRGARN